MIKCNQIQSTIFIFFLLRVFAMCLWNSKQYRRKKDIFCRPMSQFEFVLDPKCFIQNHSKCDTASESKKSIVNCHLNRIIEKHGLLLWSVCWTLSALNCKYVRVECWGVWRYWLCESSTFLRRQMKNYFIITNF